MKSFAFIFLSIAAITGPTAQAANDYRFLKDTPVARFTPADLALMRGAIDQALSGEPDGAAQTWRNEHTGASGTAAPAGVDARNPDCRRLRIATAYQHLQNEGTYTYCRTSAGKWKLK